MATHGNDLFPHWRKEMGRPAIGSVDDVFGANVAAGRVDDDAVDEETRSVCVYSQNDEHVQNSLDSYAARLRDEPAHPVRKLHSRPSLRHTPATFLARQLLQVAARLLPDSLKHVFVKKDITPCDTGSLLSGLPPLQR
ncbi:hypothetical protein ARMSODRAFT_1027639 [Armillaria solidipes]|uniref:Uncharacterized protein n=1 Tax=Armillaria solidipes TaxID=1076256 RepID=A0A2H3AN71_9AGAR|nr:hypothetical protein ARMSODRAFT_1027639 [Armillaria solidipes]